MMSLIQRTFRSCQLLIAPSFCSLAFHRWQPILGSFSANIGFPVVNPQLGARSFLGYMSSFSPKWWPIASDTHKQTHTLTNNPGLSCTGGTCIHMFWCKHTKHTLALAHPHTRQLLHAPSHVQACYMYQLVAPSSSESPWQANACTPGWKPRKLFCRSRRNINRTPSNDDDEDSNTFMIMWSCPVVIGVEVERILDLDI